MTTKTTIVTMTIVWPNEGIEPLLFDWILKSLIKGRSKQNPCFQICTVLERFHTHIERMLGKQGIDDETYLAEDAQDLVVDTDLTCVVGNQSF